MILRLSLRLTIIGALPASLRPLGPDEVLRVHGEEVEEQVVLGFLVLLGVQV